MLQKLLDFAGSLGICLDKNQQQQLLRYATCVWEKKDFLNLTRAATLDEIIQRHLADGLVAAQALQKHLPGTAWQLADVGAGCGYIGMTLAAVFAQAHVTLIESLERRCKFMRWAALQAGITNCTVKQLRLDKRTTLQFDGVTERAVGPLPEIFDDCMAAVKPGGLFVACQGEHPQTVVMHAGTVQPYQLPCDNKPRHLVLFKKEYATN